MDLVTPEVHLIFWQTVVFVLLLVVLGKFAWGPIMKGIREREGKISEALQKADEAEKRMEEIQQKNANLEKEAREQKEQILKEARETAKDMVEKAKGEAQEEAQDLMQRAKDEISRERAAAADKLRGEVADLAMNIAQELIRKELKDKESHNQLVEQYLNDNSLV